MGGAMRAVTRGVGEILAPIRTDSHVEMLRKRTTTYKTYYYTKKQIPVRTDSLSRVALTLNQGMILLTRLR